MTPLDDRTDLTFEALANPVRRSIVAHLATGEATVNELAAPFDMSLPAISRHIRVLERAGIVEQGRRAQFRPCRLVPGALRPVVDWAEEQRTVWEHRLDRLDAQLAVPTTSPEEDER